MSVTTADRTAAAGSEDASAAIWDWKGGQQGAAAVDHVRHLRTKGMVQGLIGAALATIIFVCAASEVDFFIFHKTVAYIAWSISGVILLSALLSPGVVFKGIDRAMGVFIHGVGVVLTVILMTPIYYLFFLPFKVLFRLGSRDKLERKFPDTKPTYWVDRSGETFRPETYTRQF